LKHRLFLHLGLAKTGTTSIQSFLRGNPDFLADHGAAYPDITAGSSDHAALAKSVLRRNPGREANHVALAMEIRRGSGASAVEGGQTPLWSEIFRRIETGAADTTIISYENFYRRPELSGFDLLAPRLKRHDVHGIIYLRAPEDWFVSLYAQSIKGQGRLKSSFANFMKEREGDLRFSAILDNIRAHIPLDHLIVGDYVQAAASDLLIDFMKKVGLPSEPPPTAKSQAATEPSLPYWAILFLLKCNQARIPDEAFVKVRQALIRGRRLDETPLLRPGLDLATPEERQHLRDVAGADAGRLRERYGVTLARRTHEPVAYRAFDDEDVEAITNALAPRLPPSALAALEAMPPI
jgi:hypothetical protein